jgi:hypothetical protein
MYRQDERPGRAENDYEDYNSGFLNCLDINKMQLEYGKFFERFVDTFDPNNPDFDWTKYRVQLEKKASMPEVLRCFTGAVQFYCPEQLPKERYKNINHRNSDNSHRFVGYNQWGTSSLKSQNDGFNFEYTISWHDFDSALYMFKWADYKKYREYESFAGIVDSEN